MVTATKKPKNRVAKLLTSTNGNGHAKAAAAKGGKAAKPAKAKSERVSISMPDMRRVRFRIKGIDPYMQLRFSMKAQNEILAKHREGGAAKSKKPRVAKDTDADFKNATYRFNDGSYGLAASSFRNACISACRTVGFKMTVAKQCVFIIADGRDVQDGTPLTKLIGKPEISIMPVRNDNGVVDMRTRAIWHEWSAVVTVEYDAGMMTLADLTNLMARAGLQVGVGEGRPDSKKSNGIGMGRFEIESATK